jgi:hypothetical protein
LDPTEQYLNNIAYSTGLSWLPAKFNPVGKYYQYDSNNGDLLGYGLFDQQYRLVVPCSGLYRFRVTVAGTPSLHGVGAIASIIQRKTKQPFQLARGIPLIGGRVIWCLWEARSNDMHAI